MGETLRGEASFLPFYSALPLRTAFAPADSARLGLLLHTHTRSYCRDYSGIQWRDEIVERERKKARTLNNNGNNRWP